MSKPDEPERHFVVEKKPVSCRSCPNLEHPNLVAGAEMSVIGFFGDILKWMERRRAAKARKRQMRDTDSAHGSACSHRSTDYRANATCRSLSIPPTIPFSASVAAGSAPDTPLDRGCRISRSLPSRPLAACGFLVM